MLGGLTPKNARTDRIIFILRYAANLAVSAALIRGLESKKALDATREEAATSLNSAVACLTNESLPKTPSLGPTGRSRRG